VIGEPLAPYLAWAKARPRVAWDLASSNLLGCTLADAPWAHQALQITAANDEGLAALVEAIAARYGLPADCVATATGASGANFLAFAALVGPGDEVLVERPGYDPLVGAPRLLGARVTRFDRWFEDGYRLDPAAVEQALSPRTRLVVVTNLHNPSGVVAAAADLAAVGEVAARVGARVLVDEVYLDTAWDGAATTAATLGETFVVTSSLTKSYGLAGLRCGWVVGAPDVIARVRRARDVVDGTGAVPAEAIAAAAFGHLDALAARARALVGHNFSRVRETLGAARDVEWVAPAGGTVAFPRLRGRSDAGPFVARLQSHHSTAVVPGHFFEAPAHFRVGFGGHPDVVEHGLAALALALEREGG